MKAAELLVRCLENEGVDRIFGIPGEDLMLHISQCWIHLSCELLEALRASYRGRTRGPG